MWKCEGGNEIQSDEYSKYRKEAEEELKQVQEKREELEIKRKAWKQAVVNQLTFMHLVPQSQSPSRDKMWDSYAFRLEPRNTGQKAMYFNTFVHVEDEKRL